MERKKVQIVDLDSCISDDHWRLHLINPAHPIVDMRYEAYHTVCGNDDFVNCHVLRGDTHRIVISTARPTTFFYLTQRWLKENSIPFEHLMMRNVNDHRSAPEIKLQHIEWLTQVMEYDVLLENIEEFIDDRLDVLAAVREKYPSIATRHITINGVVHG